MPRSLFASTGSGAGLRALSVAIGTFILFMGIDKWSWLTDATVLASRFQEWLETAPAASRWYLQNVAIPGTAIFARLVPIAEMALGTALIVGLETRRAAALALIMVINFHFASDVLFHYSYLTNAYGLPVLGSLLALAIGGSRLPLSLSK
jgi:uncharacterized membrane protein YphA (DoxX/SURF4 family)